MKMRTTITLRKATAILGQEMHYVVDKDQALALKELTGNKRITVRNISALKRLGYTITYA